MDSEQQQNLIFEVVQKFMPISAKEIVQKIKRRMLKGAPPSKRRVNQILWQEAKKGRRGRVIYDRNTFKYSMNPEVKPVSKSWMRESPSNSVAADRVSEQRNIHIDRLQKNKFRAQEIPGKVGAEKGYSRDQLASEDSLIRKIDNTLYVIEKTELPFYPIFGYRYDIDRKQEVIIINKSHALYREDSSDSLIAIATAMQHAKQSMTGREAEVFIRRFHQNMQIIESDY